MKNKDEELKVVAVVQINSGEALVLNRPLNFIYEEIGRDLIGSDGPFKRALFYSPASAAFKAFAGSEMTLNMRDGSQRKVKDHWWSGCLPEHQSVTACDLQSLKKCYVFFGGMAISPEDYQTLRDSYTGCVYPYWDYEKLIKYDDMRKNLCRRLFHEQKRVKSLIAEVKKKQAILDGGLKA
ncbi:TPA: hypothetical protein LVM72_004250 [Klebsiella michiganensis]|uniref:Uncharacterized protein n=1 Tax=Klebsiella michiganensis TaxID=1134687 RepID=A0AB35PZQ6_9ENTR|nr:hypothetical protein [Klebsiella michiganensis]MDS7901673.1 hypothetical protein [Klebsiella michiganensis]HBM3002556.1 hypothetical protein [Klebsiella michiganensis]HBM3072316.1 hypothetical protein [Klebsiella michiganensis]HBM3216210.1 hypothetical protein [Klebsiella michiganensis]HDX8764423.1 hypothetical protein [Klebsiella michiganensis]